LEEDEDDMKPHKCPTCKTAFLTAYYLKKHIATAHEGKLLRSIDASLGATPPIPSEISMKN
jgi:hypothetical protein